MILPADASNVIVMTGASSGIGRVAAETLLRRPGALLIAGARTQNLPTGAHALPLDLAALASVREFAAGVIKALDGARIDTLLLNAGGQRPTVDERSVDGHELTFAINHLGPYLLLRLLMPHLARGARIVLTTSGTHDPAEKTGVPAPRHADAAWLANPAIDPQCDARPTTAGMRAYSASKLCNLLIARALAACPEAAIGAWTVLAYDPGLTPGTGLVRSQHWAVRSLVWPLLPLAIPFSRSMNSLADAGGALAALALDTVPAPGRLYASLRKGRITWPDPSDIARDDAVMTKLWDDSAALVGLAAAQ